MQNCCNHSSFSTPDSVVRTTWVSWYQKSKTNLDFTEERDSEWQWHQLGCMQVCILLQTDNHASTPPLSFLQARCPSCRPTNSVKALKAVVVVVCRRSAAWVMWMWNFTHSSTFRCRLVYFTLRQLLVDADHMGSSELCICVSLLHSSLLERQNRDWTT